jgi:hypothetical protein
MTTDSPPKAPVEVAFALGGLAGNNAHGAGFLQAALDGRVRPQMLSFTSGQILWVYRYLCALGESSPPGSLRQQLAEDIEGTAPFHQPDIDLITLGLFGKAGVFRLARHEFFLDAVRNVMGSLERMLKDPLHIFFLKELLREIPARSLVPLFEPSFFETLSDAFNARTDIGLAFNSFEPSAGLEIVHLNEAAKTFLDKKAGQRSHYRSRTLYKDITPEYVRDGLWIYQYGFDDNCQLDGAYYRQVLLSELVPAKVLFVARPVHYKWLGQLPSSWAEIEDLKTEISFNGAYQGERDKILLVNKLIDDGVISDPRYHWVEIHEIEPETQESFFDYVFEDLDLFDRARVKARTKFEELGLARAAKGATEEPGRWDRRPEGSRPNPRGGPGPGD